MRNKDKDSNIGNVTKPRDIARRRFLTAATAGTSVGVVAGYNIMPSFASTVQTSEKQAGWSGAHNQNVEAGMPRKRISPIIRDFGDPLLEMIRLLNEAAEIEQDLMVEYLYAAFSLKPAYNDIIGYGSANSHDFLGVAIEEMQHLGAVNRLLVAIGAQPVLRRCDFPYEVDIYPFPFELSPCTRVSLAKYTYCEAPASVFDPKTGDQELIATMNHVLGTSKRPNFVGSLYDQIIALTYELENDFYTSRVDWQDWREKLEHIKEEGEDGHYMFFRDLLMGEHPLMKKHKDVWNLPQDHEHYPSWSLKHNVTAYYGHPNAIQNKYALQLAWLGNLAYWSTLVVLDMLYRGQMHDGAKIAQEMMMGPVWSLAKHLPRYGYGLPMDPLSMSVNLSPDPIYNRYMLIKLLREAQTVTQQCQDFLPDDYPTNYFHDLRRQIEERSV